MKTPYYDNGPYLAALLRSREVRKTANENDWLWLGLLSALALLGVLIGKGHQQSKGLQTITRPDLLPAKEVCDDVQLGS